MTAAYEVETARLLLRRPIAADHAALHACWADPVTMADLGPVKSAEESDATIARHAAYPGDLGFRSVVRRADGEVLGFCGLKPGAPDTPIAGELEAGWLIGRAHWRRGYALEAMRAMLDWGWRATPGPRIVAITASRNLASRAMMARSGMTHQTALDFRHPAQADDSPLADTVVYALSRPAIGG